MTAESVSSGKDYIRTSPTGEVIPNLNKAPWNTAQVGTNVATISADERFNRLNNYDVSDRADIGRVVQQRSVLELIQEKYTGNPCGGEQFKQCMSGVKKLRDIKDKGERREAFLGNAAWLYSRSAEVVRKAQENEAEGRSTLYGIDDPTLGLPPSRNNLFFSRGYSAEQKLQDHIYFYNLSRAAFQDMYIDWNSDLDGTVENKSLLTVGLRRIQSMEQLHNFMRVIQIISDENITGSGRAMGGFSTNTARFEQFAMTSVDGPTDEKRTYITHNNGIEVVLGLDPEIQCEGLDWIGVAMGNGCFKSVPHDYTYISSNFHIADRLMQSGVLDGGENLPPYMQDLYLDSCKEMKFYTQEPKGLQQGVVDHDRYAVNQSTVYKHHKLVMKFYSDQVLNRVDGMSDTEALDNFKKKVLTDDHHGLYGDDGKGYEVLDGEGKVIEVVKLAGKGTDRWKKVYALEKEFAEAKGYGHTPEEVTIIGFKLDAAKKAAMPYIRLLGSEADPIDIMLNESLSPDVNPELEKMSTERLNEKLNYLKLLETDPQAFFEKMRHGRAIGGCFHPHNSRRIPLEGAHLEFIKKQRVRSYLPEVREDIRKYKYHQYRHGTADKVNVDVDKFIGDGMRAYFDGIRSNGNSISQADGLIKYIRWRISEHLKHGYTKNELENCSLFECDEDKPRISATLNKEWEEYWAARHGGQIHENDHLKAATYQNWLKDKFAAEGLSLTEFTANNLASFVSNIVPDGISEGTKTVRVELVINTEKGLVRVNPQDHPENIRISIGNDGKLLQYNQYVIYAENGGRTLLRNRTTDECIKIDSNDLKLFVEAPDADGFIEFQESDIHREVIKDKGDGYLEIDHRAKEMFAPDELFAIKGQTAYDQNTSQLAVLRLDHKVDSLRPYGQHYVELLINEPKSAVINTFKHFYLNSSIPMYSGDSASDIEALAKVVQADGIARVIYDLIDIDQIYSEIIKQRVKMVDDIKLASNPGQKQRALEELWYAQERFGVYGLHKVDGGYVRVRVNRNGSGKYVISSVQALDNKRRVHDSLTMKDCDTASFDGEVEDKITLNEGDVLEFGYESVVISKEDLLKEITSTYKWSIDKSLSPAHMLRRTAEGKSFLTGEPIDYDKAMYKEAARISEIAKADRTPEEQQILFEYRWSISEMKYRDKYPFDHITFPVIREYSDTKAMKQYYRNRYDFNLYTIEGEKFIGEEASLKVREIKRDPNATSGVFIYEDTGQPFDFPNAEFIDSLAIEESTLLSPSPLGGMFGSDGFMKLVGMGSVNKGRDRLENFLRKLPKRFSTYLEWCGGLMGLGSVLRLIGMPIGEDRNIFQEGGYWVSNISRAAACFGGMLRGICNVNRNWDIAFAEAILMGSSLFLRDGGKHLGFAVGQVFQYTGRGIDTCRRNQMVNSFTRDQKENGVDSKDIDPRQADIEVVKFSQDKIVIPTMKAFKNAGLSEGFGEAFGRLVSGCATPFLFIKNVIKQPGLIFQYKDRLSEKSGHWQKLIPSVGHMMGMAGVLSGVGAIVATTFGRMERFGDIAEHKFNNIGRWAVSFATAIVAPAIWANGKEIASNPLGLPELYGGLDGEDTAYRANRAGKAQQIAAFGYAAFPLFGLHNEAVASLYDIATGFYFGLPGANMGVAQEETINSFHLGKSALIEGQRYMSHRDGGTRNIDSNYMLRKAAYVSEDGKRPRYNPELLQAV